MIDTLYTSSNGNLYAGTEESGGKFSGYAVADGRLKGAYRTGMTGKPLGRIVGEPLDLKAGDALPGNADLKLEGATTVGIAQYLQSANRLQEAQAEDEPKHEAKSAPKAAKPKKAARPKATKQAQDDRAAEDKAEEAGE